MVEETGKGRRGQVLGEGNKTLVQVGREGAPSSCMPMLKHLARCLDYEQHDCRPSLPQHRQLFKRADELRQEYNLLRAENGELRLELSRRDAMLAESRDLMGELQRKLKQQRNPIRVAVATPESVLKSPDEYASSAHRSPRAETPAAPVREHLGSVCRGTPVPGLGLPIRVFSRKASRPREAPAQPASTSSALRCCSSAPLVRAPLGTHQESPQASGERSPTSSTATATATRTATRTTCASFVARSTSRAAAKAVVDAASARQPQLEPSDEQSSPYGREAASETYRA